jgi:hypothetical protein
MQKKGVGAVLIVCSIVVKIGYLIIIIIIINRNWVVTRWQWLFYVYTKYEIGYY